MLYGVFILVAVSGLLWLAYRRPRPRRWLLPRRAVPRAVAAVDRQHRHLQAGGLIGTGACAKAKARFRTLCESGKADQIERELRGGLDFAVQVRALAELATPAAARLLERQLARTLTGDPVEQSWYWLDVAAALRAMNRGAALPAVLRCAEATAGLPQGAALAAEAVAFADFPAALRHPNRDVTRMALRALVVVARAARDGALDVAGLVRAGLCDRLAEVAALADRTADPWLTGAVIEAERLSRRLEHWSRFLPVDARAMAEQQALRLSATAERRRGWLAGAADRLLLRFPMADADEQGEALRCLFELRADAAKLFPHLPDRRVPWWVDAVRALQWSRSPVVGPVLAGQALRLMRKTRHHGRAAVILTALRGHACYETERTLLRSSVAANPALRHAAVGSLGWWPPFDPARVMRTLRIACTDPDAETRTAAVSALARLGERAALAEVAAGLRSEEAAIRQRTAARVAAEELSWSWPDLEAVAESDDADAATAAAEALERLREGLFGFAR